MSARVLVTGATGFVGRHLCASLAAKGYRVRAALRSAAARPEHAAESVVVGEIGSRTEWSSALDGIDFVVHAAARVHMMSETGSSVGQYLETNAEGTRRFAESAAAAGVKRFVFVSSIKVNGEETSGAYTSSDTPNPRDPYGESKWRAEQYLANINATRNLDFCIVRPPLVYGPGVRANFLRLMRWVDREYPLPFGAIHNRRSLVAVWNLADLLSNVLENSTAGGRTLMVSDGQDISTPELVIKIAHAMGRRPRVFSIPSGLLRLGGLVLGRRAEISRLCGSLCVDPSQTISLLGWRPPLDTDSGLAKTVEWYKTIGIVSR